MCSIYFPFDFQLPWNELREDFLLPKCFFPLPFLFFPHQKALNQFHALQMLFTLLGVKHLLLAPAGCLSIPCSLFPSPSLAFFQRLHKEACRSSGPVWKWSIAHNVPSRMGGAVYLFPVFTYEGHCLSALLIQPTLYFVLQFHLCIHWFLGVNIRLFKVVAENLFPKSKEILQSIK